MEVFSEVAIGKKSRRYRNYNYLVQKWGLLFVHVDIVDMQL